MAITITVNAVRAISAVTAFVESLSVNPAVLLMKVGESQQLSVTAVKSDGTTSDVTAAAQYQSDGAAVSVTAAGIVTVTPAVIISLTPLVNGQPLGDSDSTWLVITQQQQLQINATMSDHTVRDVTSESTYSSDNQSVAAVNAAGLVTAVAEGSAVIGVADGDKQTMARFEVTPVVSIFASNNKGSDQDKEKKHGVRLTVPTDHQKQLYLTAVLWDGSLLRVTEGASFVSADPTVVMVDDSGLVTGVGPGDTMISVSYKHATTTAEIKVPGNKGQ